MNDLLQALADYIGAYFNVESAVGVIQPSSPNFFKMSLDELTLTRESTTCVYYQDARVTGQLVVTINNDLLVLTPYITAMPDFLAGVMDQFGVVKSVSYNGVELTPNNEFGILNFTFFVYYSEAV